MQRFREFFVGGERAFGLLLLPLFLMTALIGATLAGALAILYYGQQVSRLEAETSDARAQVLEAREEVLEAAEEARRAIEQQVEEVRQALADDPPIEGPEDAGVYAIAASHVNGERRVGSGFSLASSDGETIVVTTYRLVATEDGFAVPNVDVLLPGRTATARVHNFDRNLDIATLVLSGGAVPVTDWRPADEDLGRGDRLYLAGIAGPGAAAVLQGNVGSVAPEAVVPSIPVNDFLAGGPLLDSVGRVVAVASLNYLPFGRVAGEVAYGVPIRALCRELIQCAEADQGAASLRGEGGRGERAEPPREPPPPLPSPEPLPPPEPEPEPQPEPEPAPEATPTPSPTPVPRPPPPPNPSPTQPPATTPPAPG